MAHCSYCGRNSIRYENYPAIETVQVTQEKVKPPYGVRDRGIRRNITHRTYVLGGRSFQVCRSCGAVWSGPESYYYDDILDHWRNRNIDPAEYESYRREWHEAVRRHRLNLRPNIHK
jgi:hypothetical protein